MPYFVAAWIIGSLAVAAFAQLRGHSWWGLLVLSLIVSPVAGFLVVVGNDPLGA